MIQAGPETSRYLPAKYIMGSSYLFVRQPWKKDRYPN